MTETVSTQTPVAALDPPDHVRLRELCLAHAADLVTSAERVLDNDGFPNIAYHLAILALEEIGKAGMIASRAVVGTARDSDWMEKRFDDHVWKIQWAVWTPTLTGGRIDPKEFEEARRFAQSMHARRLRGLYVDPNADVTSMAPPRAAVRIDQATSVLNMARARLDMENATGAPAVDSQNDELKWFLDTINDEIGGKRIFSKPFIEKYQELGGDTRAWVVWARSEFDKIAAEEKAHLQRELARVPSAPGDSKPKWVIKIRLYTPSHSIRPKVLSFWNKQMSWARLSSVGRKKELLLELSLADSFTLQNIYDAGLSRSKLCIVGLNLGSLGFFWYELPRQTSRYYESIKDLDAPTMDVAVARGLGLLHDWKQGALSEKNLRHAIECIAAFGPMSDEQASPIFGPYLQGLVYLSKSDIHLSCEIQARAAFIQTLRAACRHFGDWDGNDANFIPSLHRFFEPVLPEVSHRDLLFAILVPSHRSTEGPIADAISAKRIADLYLVFVADRIISGSRRQKSPEPN
jgi:AbiV family abortive infection protein